MEKVENIVDDGEEVAAALYNRFAVLALLFGKGGAQQQVAHAHDAVHRRADFMAHVGEERLLRAAGPLGRAGSLYQLQLILLSAR